MYHVHFHLDLHLAAYEPVDAVGIVALQPDYNGVFRCFTGGEAGDTAPCHYRLGVELHGAGLCATTVATGLGIGYGNAVYVQPQAYCLIEVVCNVGDLYLMAVNQKDYDVFMIDTIFYTTISLLTGILVDISYGFIDPRIRMGEK